MMKKKYCEDLDIRLAFPSHKLSNMFSVKCSIPNTLRSQVVYKFTCAGCHAKVREHLLSDRNSHIYKHL